MKFTAPQKLSSKPLGSIMVRSPAGRREQEVSEEDLGVAWVA